MSWAGSETCSVYLSRDALVLLRKGAPPERRAVPDGQTAAHILDGLLLEHRKLRLQVYLSGALCQPLLLPPTPARSARSDLPTLARALLARQLGAESDHELWIAEPVAGRDSLAVAVPRTVLEGLRRCEAVRTKKAHLAAIQPWWTGSLNGGIASAVEPGWLALSDAHALVLFQWTMAGRRPWLTGLTVLPPVASLEEVSFLMKRRMMSAAEGGGRGRVLFLDTAGALFTTAGADIDGLIAGRDA